MSKKTLGVRRIKGSYTSHETSVRPESAPAQVRMCKHVIVGVFYECYLTVHRNKRNHNIVKHTSCCSQRYRFRETTKLIREQTKQHLTKQTTTLNTFYRLQACAPIHIYIYIYIYIDIYTRESSSSLEEPMLRQMRGVPRYPYALALNRDAGTQKCCKISIHVITQLVNHEMHCDKSCEQDREHGTNTSITF